MAVLFKLSLFLCCFSHIQSWTHHLILDKDSKFQLFWLPTPQKITFEIQVETLGFVSIGFSPNGAMKNSDIIYGYVDDLTGEPILLDMKALANTKPVRDSSQDIKLLAGYQNETHTVIKFSRPWSTCDPDDAELSGDTTRLIWSYSSQDSLVYHGQKRGVRSVYLQEFQQKFKFSEETKIWDLTSKVELPNDDHTHYWCRIFKSPKLDRKHQMVALEPLIQSGNEAYVHHMVLYECHVPDSNTWFEHHVDSSGAACYSPNMPPEWTFCLATNAWAWAVGSEGEMLPDHVGMPLGEEFGGATYFMLETHYDNPAMHKNIIDSSGLRIHYTDQIRQFDTAMLLVGSEVNFLHMIPPLQDSFKTIGRCSSQCTQNSLPDGGIQILNGVLHSHLAGRKMRLRHVRNGQELPVILEDKNYDFNFQASRVPPKGRGKILPGDELILECTYSTEKRQSATFGGLSTREEMCLGFILYYPRAKLADCRSLPTLNTAMAAFGIQATFGKAFDKLGEFLQDLEGREESDSLQNLLYALTSELDLKVAKKKEILSVEDLLNKPFYTVESTPENELNLETENYRELLPKLLLSVKIKEPLELQNVSVGERMQSIDWNEEKAKKFVQNTLLYGEHNSLCLEHGRKPIIPYTPMSYPQFHRLETLSENLKCAMKSPQESGGNSVKLSPIILLSIILYCFCAE